MDNAAFKPKPNKNNINEGHDPNFQHQYNIRPKPRTKRKSKPQHASSINDLPQHRGLCSAISESSMCYPMSPLPPAIPIEHHASVSFLPIYQPSCCSSYQCCHHTKPQQPPLMPNPNINKKPIHAKYLNSLNANDSFTSLPPAIPFSGEDSPTRRRFSDPGLGNDDISITSDDTREADEILEESGEQLTSLDFEEEMIALKKDYCKLSRDLGKTKKELAYVKSIVQNQNVHSPLLITDIIKEIQNAADVREEAFISRVQSLVDQSNIAQKPSPSKPDCTSCHSVLQRLEAVEAQLKQLTLKSDQKSTSQLFEDLTIRSAGGVTKSTGFTGSNGSNDTGYTSSNGHNPFTFHSRESSVSPSTEL